MPQQLALEHALRYASQVHRDERALGATRRGVQPPRHDLLAGAVLAEDQHVRVRRPDALHELEHRPHRWRLRDQLGQAFFPERAILALEPLAVAQRAPQLDLSA